MAIAGSEKSQFKFSYVNDYRDQGQEMTLTFYTHTPSLTQLSASTSFQVTGCYTFCKIKLILLFPI